ncbi:MAG: hypothetical protein ACI4XM_04815 [Candidatus Coprovivens sp.]
MSKDEKFERAEYGWLAKLWMFLAGFTNVFLGYAFYYAMYNTDREVALKFRAGANAAIILGIIMFVLGFVLGVIGYEVPILN